ncbi:DNA ligase [Helicobacter brantae]|uniref:DNA ligase n=1 Tax=Helicobacter brantae TaxID=375927 RepID=A0A3D8J4P3_9HELI|nr:DNA ligase [Helicobacter brantae]RDU72200.1 DNA ligase [Helicobacter brantae]
MIIIVPRVLLALLLCLFCNARELWLLQNFDSKAFEKNAQNYLYSEKLDGVRAYWDGEVLYSRGGKRLSPPSFFTQNFPPFAIEGELWSKRGDFEGIASIVKSSKNPKNWEKLKFYIFEVPNQKGGILQRLEVLESYLSTHPAPFIQIIPQLQVSDSKELMQKLDAITKLGGEGLVLRDKNESYYTGRSKKAMKLKAYLDRECKILSYTQGEGKFASQVGSIICQDKNKTFKIGSGMSEDFRKNPPKLGTIITYKYFGLTKKGLPKFPIFLRIREEE